MQATCQSRFRFGGIERSPGDVLTEEDLALTSRTVIDAMRGQGLILLYGDTPASAQGPDYGLLLAKYEALSTRVELAEKTHADDLDAMRQALPAAVEAAVLKAMETFTGPSASVSATVAAPIRNKPGPKPKGGL